MVVATIWGTAVVVNPYFLLVLLVGGAWGLLPQVLLLFAVVLWHEMAHLVAAKCYGLEVSEVELLPFGGVARIDELIQLNPPVEAVVALAGPASNLLLLAAAYFGRGHLDVPLEWQQFFIQVNTVMALFNLLPGLPLDGGRVLRSRLMAYKGFRQATNVAATSGKVFALLFSFFGIIGLIYYNHVSAAFSLGVGVFLYGAAHRTKQEASYIFMQYLTRRKQEMRSKRVMKAKQLIAVEESTVGEVLRQFSPPFWHLIWVLNRDGRLLGIISEIQVINSFLEKGNNLKIREVIKGD